MLNDKLINYLNWCKDRGLRFALNAATNIDVENSTQTSEPLCKNLDTNSPYVGIDLPRTVKKPHLAIDVQVIIDLIELKTTPELLDLFKKVMVSTRLQSDQYIIVPSIDENYRSKAILSFQKDLKETTYSGKVFYCPHPMSMQENMESKKSCWASIIEMIAFLN